jgi:hypothetical protein
MMRGCFVISYCFILIGVGGLNIQGPLLNYSFCIKQICVCVVCVSP